MLPDVDQVCLVSLVLTQNDRQQEIPFSPSYYIIILALFQTPEAATSAATYNYTQLTHEHNITDYGCRQNVPATFG